jgi:hypothetical protein
MEIVVSTAPGPGEGVDLGRRPQPLARNSARSFRSAASLSAGVGGELEVRERMGWKELA